MSGPRNCDLRYATHFAPALDLFNQKHDGVAWRSKPSWSIVATEDRTVHPDLERFDAKRMGAKIVELKSMLLVPSVTAFILEV